MNYVPGYWLDCRGDLAHAEHAACRFGKEQRLGKFLTNANALEAKWKSMVKPLLSKRSPSPVELVDSQRDNLIPDRLQCSRAREC